MHKSSISINTELCISCGRCAKVCPAEVFIQNKVDRKITIINQENCITCGHCVAACPEKAVLHPDFPEKKVHPVDYTQLPTPEQMMLLCKVRRSNRAFTKQPIPQESLDMILEAAHRAPTGSNLQQVHFMLITQEESLQTIRNYTLDVFDNQLKKIKKPFMKPFVNWFMPDIKRYIPIFERMKMKHLYGEDPILRNATAVLFIYTPKSSRLGVADANLAYQNGSLMAECLGVSQFYTGFVLSALKQDKNAKLAALLGIKGTIHAGMALGMPAFRFPQYIDKKEIVVEAK